MTNEQFWSLYDNGQLENLKRLVRNDAENPIHCSEILSFTYNGKFYLRICEFKGYYGWWVGRGSNRHWKADYDSTRRYIAIKEFCNRISANAYFKKCAVGYVAA